MIRSELVKGSENRARHAPLDLRRVITSQTREREVLLSLAASSELHARRNRSPTRAESRWPDAANRVVVNLPTGSTPADRECRESILKFRSARHMNLPPPRSPGCVG